MQLNSFRNYWGLCDSANRVLQESAGTVTRVLHTSFVDQIMGLVFFRKTPCLVWFNIIFPLIFNELMIMHRPLALNLQCVEWIGN
jgi:hypothetical protein